MDYFDAKINEMINKARAINGKIQMIVKGDMNDADYAFHISEFTPDEFAEWGREIYKGFRYIVSEVKIGREVRFEAGDWDTWEKAHKHMKAFVRDAIENSDTNIYSDYIPNVGEEKCHSIEDVKLQIIVDEM